MKIFISVTFSIAVIALLSQTFLISAVDIENAKESKCFEIKETFAKETDWIMAHKTFYYPLMSRLDLYIAGTEFSGKQPKDLHEDELYYDSCITLGLTEGGSVGRGFGKTEDKFYAVTPIKGMEIYEFYAGSDEGFGRGTCYSTLSDNKTFAFSACCLQPSNQMTWAVMSTQKKLPKETVKQIYDHAESLGFNREYFTALRYDSCDLDKKKDEKIEL